MKAPYHVEISWFNYYLFSSTIVIKSGYFHMVGGFHASDGFSVLMEPPSQFFFYLTLINQYCIMKRLICLCFCTFIWRIKYYYYYYYKVRPAYNGIRILTIQVYDYQTATIAATLGLSSDLRLEKGGCQECTISLMLFRTHACVAIRFRRSVLRSYSKGVVGLMAADDVPLQLLLYRVGELSSTYHNRSIINLS